MALALGRSPVHRIIETYAGAVEALGLGVPPLFIERWGVAIHQSLSSRAREFHTHQHVLELVVNADPLETLAALYHDVVYVQVDLDVPEHYASLLLPLIEKDEQLEHGWRLLPHTGEDPLAKDILAVFGRSPGEVLTPFTGLNELASALVAGKELEGVLTREQLLAITACIEATIPFRPPETNHLERRLLALGVEHELVKEMVRRATRLSNSDVGNFADDDPARFLDNTWKLLPETNPALHTASTYGMRDYRIALMRMEGFLSKLPAERVFRAWGGEPSPEEHQRRIDASRSNIGLAVRYLRCKLYATALIEALAVESGGDAPVDFFTGGLPEANGPVVKRIEMFLPETRVPVDGDPVMKRLLLGGRPTGSSFDYSPSPVATYLFTALGEPLVLAGFEQARIWWDGGMTAREFLAKQPRETTLAIAEAAANIADTRAVALRELVKLLAARD